MSKVLIVYYSRSGNTRRIAEAAARACDAKLFRIEDGQTRSGLAGLLLSAKQAVYKSTVEIQPFEEDLRAYDLIVLATPVWAGSLSAPMRSFVRTYGAQIGAFCAMITHRERKQNYVEVIREMEGMLHHPCRAYLSLRGRATDGPQRAQDFIRRFS